MKTKDFHSRRSCGTLALLAGIGLLLPAAQVKAQDAYPLAPPVNNYNTAASVNNVYNWADVPQNQIVPIDRAVFDQGGYQLYDQAGETIVVPFQNSNLYVMKFAVSHTGGIYFINDAGQAPILYVPRHGYLENATVPGARWYPFSQRFAPADPVYLGIAPSYSDYRAMGWYPNELCYGGYYGNESFVSGGYFGPTLGLTFIFGGHPYYGWNGYRDYADNYPAPYHTGYYNRDDYRFAGRPDFNRRDSFIGSNGQGFHPSPGGFAGGGRFPGSGRPSFGGGTTRPGFGGTVPPRPGFGGTTAPRPGFGGGTTRPGFGGGVTPRPGFGATTTRPSFGGETTRPSFGGGTTTRQPGFRGITSARPRFGAAASRPAFGGTTTPRPSFGGSASRPSFGSNRSSFGSRPAPRGGSFGGGQAPRPSFGGGTPRGGGGSSPSSRPGSGGGGQRPGGR